MLDDILMGVIIAALILFTFSLLSLIKHIRDYVKEKTNENLYYWTEHEKKKDIPLENKVKNTTSFMGFVNALIQIRINQFVSTLDALHQPYNMLRIDDDIKTIATGVYGSIKKDVFSDSNLCISEEYIIEFITSETSRQLTEQMIGRNIQMYVERTEN